MITENNHYQHLWDDKPYYFPERINYSIRFGKTNIIIPFRDAVIQTSEKIINDCKNVNLFLSGGLDSQAAFLGFIYSGNKNKLNVKIIKYCNNLNEFDFESAKFLCEKYDIQYEILDFDIINFLTNDFFKYSKKIYSNCHHYTKLLKIYENLDSSACVFGLGDFLFVYQPKLGCFAEEEYEFVGRFHNEFKTFIPFYRYNSIIMKSILMDSIFTKWITNNHDHVDWAECKKKFYSKHFPELELRKKYTGYEKIMHLVRDVKMKIFYEYQIKNINKKYTYLDYIELLS